MINRKYYISILFTIICSMLLSACSSQMTADSNQSAVSLQMDVLNTNTLIECDNDYRTTYEIFVYSFCDSNGDGIGDLNGVTSKLDYIQDMGFNQIWLMPISPSTTYHKYDVIDYMDIDPEYGTMNDFDTFVQECHNRNTRVMLDLVLNHTSSQHVWFQTAKEYLQSLEENQEPDILECPEFDYYVFQQKEETGYTNIEGTNWYYESRFWSEMPDLNLDSELVRHEISDIMNFWINHGVDAFRLDAVTSYYTGNTDKNTEFLSWLIQEGKSYNPNLTFTGEAWTDRTTIGKLYESGIDSLFNFPFADQSGIIRNVINGSYSAIDYVQAQINANEIYLEANPNYIDAPFYTNHDMARSAGYYATDEGKQTKMAYALNLLMSGDAFVYYGEELGMKGSGKDENKRAPMYWSDDESNPDLCDGLNDMDDIQMKFPSLSDQMNDSNSIYHFMRHAIQLRSMYPVIASGNTILHEELSSDRYVVYEKFDDSNIPVCIAINIGEDEISIDISSLQYKTLSAVLNTSEDMIQLQNNTLTLPSYSVAVLTK